jgi:hypothetical protein
MAKVGFEESATHVKLQWVAAAAAAQQVCRVRVC